MERRSFFKICAKGTLLVAVSPFLIEGYLKADDGRLFKTFNRVKLLDCYGNPLKEEILQEEVTYVFNYPYASTPCFLIKLSEPATKEIKLRDEEGSEYIWKGGVGKEKKVVAYSAICPHQLAHPNPNESFLGYIPKEKKSMAYKEGGVIVCASHLSAFDPKTGAKVLAGPAKEPMASIILDVDEEGVFWASAVLGHAKFFDYFKSFKPELKEFYKNIRKAKKLVSLGAVVKPLDIYSKEVVIY